MIECGFKVLSKSRAKICADIFAAWVLNQSCLIPSLHLEGKYVTNRRSAMGWTGWFGGADRSDGDKGTTEKADVNIKVSKEGKVTDVIVSKAHDRANHDHYYKVDKSSTGAKNRVKW
jgi:hypothetical protein